MNRQLFMIKINRLLTLLLSGILMLGLSGRVWAEAADRDKPIDLEADTMKVDDAKQISTYAGNVILTQGTLEIHADKLVVREDKEGFQHSTSLGNPTTFRQKLEGKNEYIQGSAQRIEYDGRMDKVQLYTKAWVKRGEDVVHGDYIMYDANAEYAEVIGGSSQNSTAGTGRVRAVIQPKNKKAPVEIKPVAPPSKAKPDSSSGSGAIPTVKDSRFSRTLEVSKNAGNAQ
ncbi:MAG: lipopolysaccharide transport periplasmic protein LptA [Methylotenera sp.]|nr:lipopolysaccharide transport periplasmic protein LptA [Methylotenera sp.]MDP3777718.1 lipopolysaccharide transport periplasmic protein LptA [Methylotenera sp.]